MKKVKYIAIALTTLTIVSCNNNTVTESKGVGSETVNGIVTSTFKVWGNCEMCKETIEGSLKVDGISKSDWNVDSKIMTVSYDTTKITLDKIQKNISVVGYDNEKYMGEEKAYSELPECCQYDSK